MPKDTTVWPNWVIAAKLSLERVWVAHLLASHPNLYLISGVLLLNCYLLYEGLSLVLYDQNCDVS
jgi:hypothetical protein